MDKIDNIKSLYRTALAENGDSPASVCWPKGRQEHRFEVLLSPALLLDQDVLTLCDFGCGLAHMETYLDHQKITKFNYTGLDIVPEMVDKAKELGRNAKLIDQNSTLKQRYDCVVASGVFNLMYFDDYKKNQNYVFERITMLIAASRKYFACDFMRPDVDYIQDGAWHQPYDALITHLSQYSRDIEIIMRVLPYEYTIRVHLDA